MTPTEMLDKEIDDAMMRRSLLMPQSLRAMYGWLPPSAFQPSVGARIMASADLRILIASPYDVSPMEFVHPDMTLEHEQYVVIDLARATPMPFLVHPEDSTRIVRRGERRDDRWTVTYRGGRGAAGIVRFVELCRRCRPGVRIDLTCNNQLLASSGEPPCVQ